MFCVELLLLCTCEPIGSNSRKTVVELAWSPATRITSHQAASERHMLSITFLLCGWLRQNTRNMTRNGTCSESHSSMKEKEAGKNSKKRMLNVMRSDAIRSDLTLFLAIRFAPSLKQQIRLSSQRDILQYSPSTTRTPRNIR